MKAIKIGHNLDNIVIASTSIKAIYMLSFNGINPDRFRLAFNGNAVNKLKRI